VTDVLFTGNAPTFANPGDAGADLRSTETFILPPGSQYTAGTGVRIALEEGYVAFAVPRSGLAAKHGITIVNSPGTIDSGYRGEIKIILLNTSQKAYEVVAGDRIAQLVILQTPQVNFIKVDDLLESARGEHGFGSSGYGRSADA
jgi:dUTP pyrophosphatase